MNRWVDHYQSYIFSAIDYYSFQTFNKLKIHSTDASEFITPYFRHVMLTPFFNIELIKLIVFWLQDSIGFTEILFYSMNNLFLLCLSRILRLHSPITLIVRELKKYWSKTKPFISFVILWFKFNDLINSFLLLKPSCDLKEI